MCTVLVVRGRGAVGDPPMRVTALAKSAKIMVFGSELRNHQTGVLSISLTNPYFGG
jgi:hypothetical protein